MSTTTVYISPTKQFTKATSLNFGVLQQLGALATVGDILDVYFDYQVQVSAMVSYIDSVASVGTADTVSREFRTSTDGTTWSAYVALTNGNLAALTPTATNLFYIHTRYTRTGAAPGGTVRIQALQYFATINPDAAYTETFHIQSNTVRGNLQTLIPALVGAYVQTFGSGDAYEIDYIDRLGCVPKTKPIIYFNSIDLTGRRREDACTYVQNVSLQMGIKRKCPTKNTAFTAQYNAQIESLIEMWNPFVSQHITYNVLGHKGARLGDFGIFNTDTSGMIELRDGECQCEMNEFRVNFEIKYKVNHN